MVQVTWGTIPIATPCSGNIVVKMAQVIQPTIPKSRLYRKESPIPPATWLLHKITHLVSCVFCNQLPVSGEGP